MTDNQDKIKVVFDRSQWKTFNQMLYSRYQNLSYLLNLPRMAPSNLGMTEVQKAADYKQDPNDKKRQLAIYALMQHVSDRSPNVVIYQLARELREIRRYFRKQCTVTIHHNKVSGDYHRTYYVPKAKMVDILRTITQASDMANRFDDAYPEKIQAVRNMFKQLCNINVGDAFDSSLIPAGAIPDKLHQMTMLQLIEAVEDLVPDEDPIADENIEGEVSMFQRELYTPLALFIGLQAKDGYQQRWDELRSLFPEIVEHTKNHLEE